MAHSSLSVQSLKNLENKKRRQLKFWFKHNVTNEFITCLISIICVLNSYCAKKWSPQNEEDKQEPFLDGAFCQTEFINEISFNVYSKSEFSISYNIIEPNTLLLIILIIII